MNADREWLRSLGMDEYLIDSPAGNEMICVIFGDPADDESSGSEEWNSVDHGFMCVA